MQTLHREIRRPFLALAAAAAPLTAQQIPSARLTAPTSSIAEPFVRVTGAIELSGTRVLVADEREGRLVVVDFADGAVKPVGRRGRGPGEYLSIGRLLPRAGGGAYLVDFAQRRLLPVNADGTTENSVPYPGVSLQLRGADARGVLYGDSFMPRQGSTLPDSMWILRWDLAGSRVDTLMKYNANVDAMIVQPGEKFEAFAPRDSWGPLTNGDIALLEAATYRLSVWSAGRQARTSAIPWEPVRVTQAEKDAFLKEQAAQPVRSVGQPGAAPRPAPPRPETEFPATMAPFENEYVWRSPTDFIWVERLRGARDTLPLYDVIDGRTGTLAGRVELRARSRIAGLGSDAVYVGERDADDIVTLRRYALPVFARR